MRGLPQQGDRRPLLLPPGELQPERVGPPAEQMDRRAILRVVPRLDRGVDQRPDRVVDPELDRILRLDDELVLAGLRGQHRALPVHPELLRVLPECAQGDQEHRQPDPAPGEVLHRILLGDRAIRPEIEPDLRVDALEGGATATAPPATTGPRVLALEAPRLVPAARVAEAADQVGHGVAILPDGHAREFDPRRPIGIAGLPAFE